MLSELLFGLNKRFLYKRELFVIFFILIAAYFALLFYATNFEKDENKFVSKNLIRLLDILKKVLFSFFF